MSSKIFQEIQGGFYDDQIDELIEALEDRSRFLRYGPPTPQGPPSHIDIVKMIDDMKNLGLQGYGFWPADNPTLRRLGFVGEKGNITRLFDISLIDFKKSLEDAPKGRRYILQKVFSSSESKLKFAKSLKV